MLAASENPGRRSSKPVLTLDADRERQLLECIQKGDERARAALIEAHLPMVRAAAARFRHSSLELDELVAEGNLALLRALASFDPSRGVRFRTHAAYWVRAAMLDWLVRGSRTFAGGTGPYRTKVYFRLRRDRARMQADGVPSYEIVRRLAATFDVTEERVERWLAQLDARVVSTHGEGDDAAPVVLASAEPDASVALEQAQTRGRLDAALEEGLRALDPRERWLIERSFTDEEREPTVADLARQLGVSRERGRQLQQRALGKLRRTFEAHGMTTSRAA